MNPLVLLMGLLVLSYIGSFLVGGRAIRGFGLSSGSEYVALGFVLGPVVLGVVERSTIEAFRPLAHVALGWLALTIGLRYGMHDHERVAATRLFGAALSSLFCGGLVGAAVYLMAGRVLTLAPWERLMMAGGIGAAGAETTRHAVRWVVERHQAKGPLASLVGELSEADDLVPLLAVAVLFSLAPHRLTLPLRLGWWAFPAMTLGLGLVCGAIAAILLGREFRLDESWGVLLGTGLLAIGTAVRLGLSPLSVMFFMGVALSALSRHRHEIAEMVAPTERPVLLPTLLLAGAYVDPLAIGALPWMVLAALCARIVAKLGEGAVVNAALGTNRETRARWLGFGLLSSGALTMSIGLGFELRFPGAVGNMVLSTAAILAVFGEFVGPSSLRAALERAGEIAERAAGATDAPSAADAPGAAETAGAGHAVDPANALDAVAAAGSRAAAHSTKTATGATRA